MSTRRNFELVRRALHQVIVQSHQGPHVRSETVDALDALAQIESEWERLERLGGELRRLFRHRMTEWRETDTQGYHEDDVEAFLLEAERAACRVLGKEVEKR